MKQILIFAGTTEGRQLIERLCQYHIQIHACRHRIRKKKYSLIANRLPFTHSVWILHKWKISYLHMHSTASLMLPTLMQWKSHKIFNLPVQINLFPYLRLLRENSEYENCVFVSNTQECISYLNQTSGAVLLTTGSKELVAYTNVEHFKERLYARVLPMTSVVEQCIALGFQGKHLICMQGPFTVELNQALLKQINAKYMVTKKIPAATAVWAKNWRRQKSKCHSHCDWSSNARDRLFP